MAKFFMVMECKHVTAADRTTQFYMRTSRETTTHPFRPFRIKARRTTLVGRLPPSLKALRVGRNEEVGTALLQFRALTQQSDTRTRIGLQESDVLWLPRQFPGLDSETRRGWPSWLWNPRRANHQMGKRYVMRLEFGPRVSAFMRSLQVGEGIGLDSRDETGCSECLYPSTDALETHPFRIIPIAQFASCYR